MKAMVRQKYGPPEVFNLAEVEKPVPSDDEVLIKIHAASVNPLDWHILRGEPFIARLSGGLFKPGDTILGADVAGRIESVGKNVQQYKAGDEVYGDLSGDGLGAFAQYVCVSQKAAFVPKPENLTFEQAAAVPAAAITALQGLRHKVQIRPGQKVLINGASGGVGTFAVQIAKSFEAIVTGVCSTGNLEMLRSMGAEEVIDYTLEDFSQNGKSYDLIFDAVGNRSVPDLKRALTPHGNCVIIGYTTLSLLFQHMVLGPMMSMGSKQRIGIMGEAKPNKKDLLVLKELIETGKVRPVIDRRYPLGELADAIGYLEKGHARGKVVITVEHNHKT